MDNSELIIQDRRALHRIPEIGLDLPQTVEYCERALAGMGLAPRRLAGGLVADLGTKGPLFGWRADMDALPIQEETGLPFASTIPGRMHACGHDAHTATALGIARHFSTFGADLPCRLRLVLQPGEEGYDGALEMIKAGVLDGVEAMAGMHVGCIFPEMARGCFGTRRGTVMASCTFFDLTFTGRGTHGAYPHQGADPLMAASQFVAGLQEVRYRAASPVHPTVISIGAVQGGTAANVVPETVLVKGTMRTTTWEDLDSMKAHLDRHIRAVALANGVEASFKSDLRAPITINSDSAMAEMLEAAVVEAHGPDSFQWLPEPTLGGEDFGAFLQKVPGVFFFLATNPQGGDAPHHHPKFMVDDSLLSRTIPVVEGLIRRWAARH